MKLHSVNKKTAATGSQFLIHDYEFSLEMSTSMYEWNQQRTTLNLDLPRGGMKYRKSRTMECRENHYYISFLLHKTCSCMEFSNFTFNFRFCSF